MNFVSLIEAKRDGFPLNAAQIRLLVDEFTAGRIPDYQMAAFLMAVYFQGLAPEETRELTLAMRDSGEKLEFPPDTRPLADKHSTGGVGDKVSLPLAPLLACLGFRVPMISGRGLGITGGTLDKLESIPGLSTAMSPAQIVDQVQRIGIAMAGQTETMIPADKKLYALRDVTGTVPSIPLIVASILSKKLTENIQYLVLDIKCGRGAFMPAIEKARQLAEALVELSEKCGVKTGAIISNMDFPLGRAAGNWLEIRETVDCLEGRGPADVMELVTACARRLLLLSGLEPDAEAANRKIRDCFASGAPLRKWEELLQAQGADMVEYRRRLAAGNLAPVVLELRADAPGFVSSLDARVIGEIVRDLGGGRLTKESVIYPEVGLDCLAKPGERLEAGALMGRVHARDGKSAASALERLRAAFVVVPHPSQTPPLILAAI